MGLESLSSEERLWYKGWFNQKEEWLWGQSTALMGCDGRERERCSWAFHSGAWWQGETQWHKLKCGRLRLKISRNFFPMVTPQQWSQGPGRLGCL